MLQVNMDSYLANELLKYGGKAMTDQLTAVIDKTLKLNRVPEEWETSILILLFKIRKSGKLQRDEPVKYYYESDIKNLI